MPSNTRIASTPQRHKQWVQPRIRSLLYQGFLLLAVGLAVWFLVSNTLQNLALRNIATGFGFLGDEAGFAIGEAPIPYTASDSYGRAILVGLANTLKVSVVAIIGSTILGVLLGVGRLSRNWLVSRVAGAYIEIMRNIPLLLQLFFWYAIITEVMPGPRQAHHPLPGVFISNRGLMLPALQGESLAWVAGAFLLALLLCTALLFRVARGGTGAVGRIKRPMRWCLALLVLLPALGWLAGGANLALEMPALKGFNFQGGYAVSPEFAALLTGLVLYTSAFVAEVVRSGIQAVGQGQWNAGLALGLPRRQVLRLVVLPQALRVIIPPMTSQYLNVTKNSSLAVAIGYPDIVSVVNTTLNQTGQAIEGILIIMAAYLTVSLSISLLMNWYNRRMALVER